MSSKTRPCAQCAPYLVASRSPFHFAGAWGAFQRMSATGGAAYGRPRNARTLPLLMVLPVTLPCSVFTLRGSACAAPDSATNTVTAVKAHVILLLICIDRKSTRLDSSH